MKDHNTIQKDMVIGDILRLDNRLTPVRMEMGMHCLGCPSAQREALADACMVHGVNADDMVKKLNDKLEEKV